MINVYKRVEKTKENPYGIVEITDTELLNRPFLLSLSAQDNYDKSTFGMIRTGAQAARVYTTMEDVAGFKIDEMPIDFLGLRFVSDDNYKDNYEEIVDRFLYPFLTRGGTSFEEIKKQAVKMNFMTYCDGTFTYAGIEKKIKEKLQVLSMEDKQIGEVLRCFFLVALGTDFPTNNLCGSTVTFVDVEDKTIRTPKIEKLKELIQNHQMHIGYGTLKNKNNLLVFFTGSGLHDVKKYLSSENIAKPAICAVTSSFLEDSINGKIPSSEEILDTLGTYATERESTKSLLDKLDDNLSYSSTPRYTHEEAALRKELDSLFKEETKVQNEENQSRFKR